VHPATQKLCINQLTDVDLEHVSVSMCICVKERKGKEAADIQLQLTTHLSTPKGWKAELA